jgi:ankyrin repeat protein
MSTLKATDPVLIPLCRRGDRTGIERTLQASGDKRQILIEEVDIEGNTPLHVAVEAPKNELATVQCLLESGAKTNAANLIGATPLHYVCLRKGNHRGVANILLENGADVNAQTYSGKSALHFACEKNLAELVEVLCLFGADPNLVDSEGNTPMHLVLEKKEGRDTVKRQLLETLMQYNANHSIANAESLLPCHVACRNGCVRCLQLLVDRQASLQALTGRQETGLHMACIGGHAEVAQLMIQVFPASTDSVDIEGNTPLHKCALTGCLECAVVLLKAGANTSLKNNAKKTAHDLAKQRGTDLNNTHNPELVQVLKDAKKGGACRQA